MLSQGTRAEVQAGTEIDRTSDYNNTYIEVGKIYSGTFSVSGVLSGDEQSLIDSIAEQIQYPPDNPDAYGLCEPTFIQVDSASGTAYAEWKVSESAADSYRLMLAPIAIAVIIASILLLGIILAWLVSIIVQRVTEFVGVAGPDFKWVAIAAMLAAGAVIIIAATYGYGKVISDRPIMQHYDEYRGSKND